MKLKIGKVEWDQSESVSGDNADYLRLDEGENIVRIFTSPYKFYQHWLNDPVTGKKRRVRCAVENCPLCQRGEKTQMRFLIGVLSRKDNKPKILEIGSQIFNQIITLKKSKNWGDPKSYDMNVVRNAEGSQPLYSVVPDAKTPFTDEEKQIVKAFMDRVDLNKMSAAPAPEQVAEMAGLDAPVAAGEETAEAPVDASDDSFNFDNV